MPPRPKSESSRGPRPRSRREREEVVPPRTPSAERLAIAGIPDVSATRILCTSLGRGQLAAALAQKFPQAHVACWFLDHYFAQESLEELQPRAPDVDVVCTSDLPEGPFDLVAIPVSRAGQSELTRDTLQQGVDRLAEGGVLLATVDKPDEQWLHGELQKLLAKVRRDPVRYGVVYLGTRTGPPKRLRDFRCEFAFRDRGALVKAVSRPGVFSHRELDLGSRALLEAMEVQPGERVLDLGCGSGVVGLAAALRAPGVSVHGIDSTPRAIECLLAGAALNGLSSVTGRATAIGDVDEPGTFDLAVGNPPYYSQYKIAEIFVQAARRGLKPGGRVQMVTRRPEWFQARFRQLFADVSLSEHRKYTVVSATQRPPKT